MSSLLETSDQALPITEISRSAKRIMDDFQTGEKSKYVVMRNNIPAAVMMSVSYYENLLHSIEDLQLELLVLQRLTSQKEVKLISHEDMMSRFQQDA